MFAQLVQTLSRLMLLRAGPQDLPAWPLLLHAGVALYLISAMARMLLLNDLLAAFAQGLLGVGVLWAYTRMVLRSRGKPERLTQTLSALLLCGALIGLLMLGPLSTLVPALETAAAGGELDPAQAPAGAAWLWLMLALWGLFLAGHIYRHALDASLGMGILVALGYEVVLIAVTTVATFLGGGPG